MLIKIYFMATSRSSYCHIDQLCDYDAVAVDYQPLFDIFVHGDKK